LASADRIANARAADSLTIDRNCGKAMDSEAQFDAEFAEQFDVARSLVAERKRAADTDALDVAEVAREITNKLFAGLTAEILTEVDEPRDFRAERLNRAKFWGSE
jgi:hypothetical protein